MRSELNLSNLLIVMSKVIHGFQLERGSLCLFLCEPSEKNHDKFDSCVSNSNSQLALLSNYLEQTNSQLNRKQHQSIHVLQQVVEVFKLKTTYRSDLMSCDLEISEVIPLYTHNLITQLIHKLIEVTLFDDSTDPAEVSALSNFINWKERIGRERALGVIGFSTGEFDNDVFFRDFKILIDDQEINKSSFLALATPSQNTLFNKMYTTQKEVNKFHRNIDLNDKPQFDADFWFGVVSSKMDMMHEIELALIELLLNNDKEVNEKKDDRLFDQTEKQMIMKFPLFRRLSEKVQQDLFKSSNKRSYKKGSLLFLEGEQATRIFVVMSGWVKVYKSAPDGQESIEHMLTTGDVVIESSIFSSSNYNNNAQVSTEAKLLSFPAAIYRNLVSKDLTLALNSLKYLSQSSTKYQNQKDNNRLKSSKERVGQFLLREFVKQKNPNTIMLPYEKTIIASVLDMKPETFSRSLKALKKSGLSSEKQQIQVENIKTLCSYCDKEIAAGCQFKDKNDCSYNQKASGLPRNTRDTFKSSQ